MSEFGPQTPAKYANASQPPIAAAVHLKTGECTWSVEMQMDQARDMEADGFEIHWLMPAVAAETEDQS
ncbi:hypothetical protein [Leisingera methylohalidivorans]|uniref:Uncharacterized protein n=1 Tax=Leisingera methylohalidivorans DSM 14336 TaxID=999552 RepID=V9W0B9_9RHOB|nr:hypothetical protein [Leisingera methylohalidivorans]AHD03090.1 hypothetical protein METH_11230 [Leisingera methylohalidivorans DSM 14336]